MVPAGGSHLPDITVVTPVFEGGRVAFYVASRGHHADVGGISPGSMPAHATRLDEEGVVFRGNRIVHGGRFDDAAVSAVLDAGHKVTVYNRTRAKTAGLADAGAVEIAGRAVRLDLGAGDLILASEDGREFTVPLAREVLGDETRRVEC